MGSDKVDWAINGELALNCNCTVFCPCAVSLGDHPPTEGYCQTWLAVRIDNGHFNEVDLSGLAVGMLMEIFEGRPVEELQEIWQVEMIHRQSTGPIL